MEILIRKPSITYKILILFDNELIDYDAIKNNKKFLEEWIKDLKKNLNRQYKIVFDKLESLKECRGKTKKLIGTIKVGNLEIDLFSDRVNRDIRIIFSTIKGTNIIIVWGIDHHEKAYREIIRHAEGFIKNHQGKILELLRIKMIHR